MSITCACADSTHTHTEGFPDVLRKCGDPVRSAAPASVQAPLRHRVATPCRPLRVPGSSATSAKGLRGRLLTGPHASAPHAVGDPHLRLENLHLCARVTGSQRYGCSVAGLHARRTFPGRHLLARHTPRPTTRWDPPEACGMVTSLTGRAGGACGLPAPRGQGACACPWGRRVTSPAPTQAAASRLPLALPQRTACCCARRSLSPWMCRFMARQGPERSGGGWGFTLPRPEVPEANAAPEGRCTAVAARSPAGAWAAGQPLTG